MSFIKTMMLACLTATAGTASAVTAHTGAERFGYADLTNYVYKSHAGENLLRSERQNTIAGLNNLLTGKGALKAPAVAEGVNPAYTFGPSDTYGAIDVPGEGQWFYTMDYETERVVHNEYWTEEVVVGFTAKIYDGKHELIGTIKDKVRFMADETRTPYLDVTQIATRHFFNDDDNYEIMIGAAFNTETPGVMRYRTYVYRLGDAAGADGNHEPVNTVDNLVSEVLDATPAGGEENVYLSFTEESYPDIEPDQFYADDSELDWWEDWVKQSKLTITTYGKCGADGKLQKVLDWSMCILQMPGDQESSPYVISTVHKGNAYVVLSRYEEIFWNPYGLQDDMTMRERNNLEVEVYKLNGLKAELVQKSKIPVTKDQSSEAVLASYHSIGDLRYRNDVRFTENGGAEFIVTRANYLSSSDETTQNSYFIFNGDGSVKHTLFENADGTVAISDIEGLSPQQMFIEQTASGYLMHFVNLDTNERALSMVNAIEEDGNDPDPLLANADRTEYGDSYAYAFEMRYPLEEDDVTYMRVAWVDKNGKHIRTDEMNMGENVNYAQCYLVQDMLKPGTFTTADDMAYMMLIKRGHDGGDATEELLVAQACSDEYPEGKTLLHLGPDAERGTLGTIAPITMGGQKMLMVSYVGDDSATADFYALPLENSGSGVSDVTVEGKGESFSYNNGIVSAEGYISVSDLNGRTVLTGNGSADTAVLAAGIYVVNTASGSGKIYVK